MQHDGDRAATGGMMAYIHRDLLEGRYYLCQQKQNLCQQKQNLK